MVAPQRLFSTEAADHGLIDRQTAIPAVLATAVKISTDPENYSQTHTNSKPCSKSKPKGVRRPTLRERMRGSGEIEVGLGPGERVVRQRRTGDVVYGAHVQTRGVHGLGLAKLRRQRDAIVVDARRAHVVIVGPERYLLQHTTTHNTEHYTVSVTYKLLSHPKSTPRGTSGVNYGALAPEILAIVAKLDCHLT